VEISTALNDNYSENMHTCESKPRFVGCKSARIIVYACLYLPKLSSQSFQNREANDVSISLSICMRQCWWLITIKWNQVGSLIGWRCWISYADVGDISS